mgnify:CR=1 FL=1
MTEYSATGSRMIVPHQGDLLGMMKRGPTADELALIVRFACRYVDSVNANPTIHAYYERDDVGKVVRRGSACNHGEP